jgi:hypothetical protein
MRVHVGPQDGVNPRLVPALLAEPLKHIRIKPHGHDCFPAGPNDLGIPPEFFIGGACVRVGFD